MASDIRQAVVEAVAAAKISQTELARSAGMTQPQVSDYLAGRSDVRTETASRLLAALGLQISREKNSARS